MVHLKNKSLKDLAYHEIKKMIILRDLHQGEKIFEKDLSGILKMSRTPVREALLVLEKEGLVENQDRLGYVVRRLKHDEITDYYNVRRALEQYAAPLIAANINEQEIESLSGNVAEAEIHFACGDFRRFVLCSSQFHALLIKAARSPMLSRAMASLDDIATLLRALAVKKQEGMDNALEGHKTIVDILKDRDPEALERALLDHLAGSRKRNMALMELIL